MTGKNFSIKIIDKTKRPKAREESQDPKEIWTLKVIDDHKNSARRASRSSSRAKEAIKESESTIENTKFFVK